MSRVRWLQALVQELLPLNLRVEAGRQIDVNPTNGGSDSEGCGGVELSKPLKLSPMRKVE
jgi:hypothetical protein